MTKLKILLCLLCALPLMATAQEWSFDAALGLEIGGTSPLPLPAEMREIKGFNPTLCYQVQARASRLFNKMAGLSAALRYEKKGMKTEANVKSYHMAIIQDGARTEGYWTGDVSTTVKLNLLTVPLLATFKCSDNWTLYAGPYASFVLNKDFTGEVYNGYLRENDPTGEKVVFEGDSSAPYDLSDDLRSAQFGAEIATRYNLSANFALTLHLDWGLSSIFPGDYETITFAMYPIYAGVALAYCF